MNLQERTGLSEKDLEIICQAAAKQPEIEELILFGSRAKGTYRKGSDVDLAVKGKNVTYSSITTLSEQLNEIAPLPYMFDVLDYQELAEPTLKSHIDRVGMSLYHRIESAIT